MIVTHNGGNYFKFEAGTKVVLVDPVNHRSFKGASVVLNTRRPSETEPPTPEEVGPVWIDHQGEYEAASISIKGYTIGTDEDRVRTAYRFSLDDIEVVVLGHLREELSPVLLTMLRAPDILVVPAGGKPFISQEIAAKIARHIEPGIIIPSLFSDPKDFMKEFGKGKTYTPEEKLVVKKKDFTPGAMHVVLLRA